MDRAETASPIVAIDSFEGTLLLVTDDRRMLAGIRSCRRWHLAAGQLTESR